MIALCLLSFWGVNPVSGVLLLFFCLLLFDSFPAWHQVCKRVGLCHFFFFLFLSILCMFLSVLSCVLF